MSFHHNQLPTPIPGRTFGEAAILPAVDSHVHIKTRANGMEGSGRDSRRAAWLLYAACSTATTVAPATTTVAALEANANPRAASAGWTDGVGDL